MNHFRFNLHKDFCFQTNHCIKSKITDPNS